MPPKCGECGTECCKEARRGKWGKLQQLSTDAPVAQNSNSWSYWGCRWAEERGVGRGRKEGHPQSVSQPACCVAFNFINTFIILCHTEAVAQVAPATRLLPSLSPSASLSLSPASVDGNQSATAGALASHLAPDFWLNVTTAAAPQPGCLMPNA